MKKKRTVILAKFLMTFVLAGVTLGLIGKTALDWIFVLAVLQTALGYLGDLCVLERMRNLVVAVGNGFAGGLIAYILSILVPAFHITWVSLLIFALLVAAGEYFLRTYPQRSKASTP